MVKAKLQNFAINKKSAKMTDSPGVSNVMWNSGLSPCYQYSKSENLIKSLDVDNQKTTSCEMASGRPTDLPIGGSVKLIYSIANQETLSSYLTGENLKAVEVGKLESPRRGLTNPPGKPATPKASSLYHNEFQEVK